MTPAPITDTRDKDQMSMYVDVYKHHFDLFVKGVFLYFAVMGAAAGYVFGSATSRGSRIAVLLMASAISLVAQSACVVSRKWVRAVAMRVEKIAERLNIDAFPFDGAASITVVVQVVTTIFALAGLVAVGGALWGKI